ncbi:hypothetical protein BD626DRAFT_491755 [Schizophyllum amplum]|uniref:Transmembrane protein n=1 Tax=Schizophyllum amplum TaxID=97359 RepID=A0A550CHY7_9AGAR|nr:hypothetical protein BD626DRAFT_491755 [Auriculariopsis ampla]
MSSSLVASTSTTVAVPTLPATAVTHDAHTTLEMNPMDSFFGYALTAAPTHTSRHDRRLSAEAPPAYEEDPSPPEYTAKYEPTTLAMFLFKFGFLFPLFWIIGSCILLTPLTAPAAPSDEDVEAAWMPEKTAEERARIVAHIRSVEVKWAKRCLYAFIALILLGAVAGIAGWLVMSRRV